MTEIRHEGQNQWCIEKIIYESELMEKVLVYLWLKKRLREKIKEKQHRKIYDECRETFVPCQSKCEYAEDGNQHRYS